MGFNSVFKGLKRSSRSRIGGMHWIGLA